jgi:hypothetical protein
VRTEDGPTALETAMRRTGGVPNKAFQALMFAAWWGLFSEKVGHPLTTYELSKLVKHLGKSQLYRHGRAFKQAFPREGSPARLWALVCEHGVPEDYSAALGELGALRFR